MEDNIKLHWYLITTSFGNEKASMYKGLSVNRLTRDDLQQAKKTNEHPPTAIVDGVFYLGEMSSKEFSGDIE